jgi:hypothetical protein
VCSTVAERVAHERGNEGARCVDVFPPKVESGGDVVCIEAGFAAIVVACGG